MSHSNRATPAQHNEHVNPGDWHRQARCLALNVPPDTFFPKMRDPLAGLPVNICRRCPVIAECLTEALQTPPGVDHGVRGGMTQTGRELLRRVGKRWGLTVQQLVDYRLGKTAALPVELPAADERRVLGAA